jgi:hypothetical protein
VRERILCRVSCATDTFKIGFLDEKRADAGNCSAYIQFNEGRSVILPVVLYGCETWSLTLREEHRWKVFENRVLRRIFGPIGMK